MSGHDAQESLTAVEFWFGAGKVALCFGIAFACGLLFGLAFGDVRIVASLLAAAGATAGFALMKLLQRAP
jgi:hypothetical protein